MRSLNGRRDGMALFFALGAIVVIGALVTGALLLSTQEYRTGRNTLTQTRALASSEFGLGQAYSAWDKSWNSLDAGTTVARDFAPGDGSANTVRITKLDAYTYLAVSAATSGADMQQGAGRRTSTLVRLNIPDLSVKGAITSAGKVAIGGSTYLSGLDTLPAGWDCTESKKDVAGAAVSSWTKLTAGGKCKDLVCLKGAPLVSIDTTVADTNTYFKYGDLTWPQLVNMADKTVSGTVTGVAPTWTDASMTTCKIADVKNWGDPLRSPYNVCQDYFPIVYAPTDLNINGDRGQGMLLVGGNLNIQGNFTFYGTVITRGTIKLTGTGNKIVGAVMAAAVLDSTSTSTALGASTIQYSSCTVSSVLKNTASPVLARGRGWAELF
jgi:Tfp pilus assembly protein PilV